MWSQKRHLKIVVNTNVVVQKRRDEIYSDKNVVAATAHFG